MDNEGIGANNLGQVASSCARYCTKAVTGLDLWISLEGVSACYLHGAFHGSLLLGVAKFAHVLLALAIVWCYKLLHGPIL